MNNQGDGPEAYGQTNRAQDGEPGQYRPIPVPDPAAAPLPVPHQPDPAAAPVPAGHSGRTAADRRLDGLVAISGPLSFALFMLAGFVLDGWAWSWLFFMLPGIVYAYRNAAKD